jgi:hypothetical protein
MFSNELVRKLRIYAKERNLDFRVEKHRGKGGHQTAYLDDRKSVIPFSSKELKKGTLHGILKALGVDKL